MRPLNIFMYKKLMVFLILGMAIGQVASASQKTIVCSNGVVNLVMQIEGDWIYDAGLYNSASGDSLGPVDRNDITLSPGEAFIRTDVEYSATGLFTNCH